MRVIVHFLSMLVVEMNDLSSLIDCVTMKTTKNCSLRLLHVKPSDYFCNASKNDTFYFQIQDYNFDLSRDLPLVEQVLSNYLPINVYVI